MSTLIQCQNVTKRYGNTVALDNVNFAVEIPQTPTQTVVYKTTPSTGDNSNVAVYAGMAFVSATAILGAILYLRRRKSL